MKNKLFLLLLCLSSRFFADEIEISLPTQDKTLRIYISPVKNDSETSKLVNFVLQEDFKVDDRGILLKNNRLLALNKLTSTEFFKSSEWKSHKIDFVIKTNLSNNTLSIDFFDVRKQTIKSLSEIKLTKGRDDTIKALHNVSDFLMKQIFKTEGIASKRILYSYKPFQKGAIASLNNWHAEIYETDTLGLINKQVTFDNSYSINPEFTKDSKNSRNYDFVYVTYKQGQPQIYLSNVGKKTGDSLIKLRGNQLLPKMSFDGKYLAFISDASGKSDVFVQTLGSNSKPYGKPIQIYSGLSQTSASPSLSPDNKSLVFVSDKTGVAKIYIADISETLSSRKSPTLQRIKSPCTECTAPSFSPDGKKIVFSGKINGRRQIWLYDISQKKASQLTCGPEDKENPCFGSNSRHIVYNTTSPTTDLFLLDSENQTNRRLTKGSGEKHYPAFEK
ncbi:MAG: Tol-Pal system protein TolB [Chlamydiia bacterium]|nr:Tol-Pal system protein TolB [Chlamydiia bacterium]